MYILTTHLQMQNSNNNLHWYFYFRRDFFRIDFYLIKMKSGNKPQNVSPT